MECGASDTVCQVAAWLSENEFVAGIVAEKIAALGASATDSLQSVFLFFREYSQSIIGAFGFTFGAWRWWTYRERILHERLKSYIAESDRRLKDAEHDLIGAMRRPGPDYPVSLPLYASKELRSVLRERNWDKTAYALTIEQSADGQLREAIGKLERQILSARDCISSLSRQSATAHVIRGTIAASGAKGRCRDLRSVEALELFRSALRLDNRNILAQELEALQLKKLGHYDQALASFLALEQLAALLTDDRERMISVTRAMRYRAEILQLQNSDINAQGQRVFRGALDAYRLLSQTVSNSALSIRSAAEPFQGWDLLEHADTFYLAAFVSHNLDFSEKRGDHLTGAHGAYGRLADEPYYKSLLRGRRYMRLRRLAREGKERVERAQKRLEFDCDWLGQ